MYMLLTLYMYISLSLSLTHTHTHITVDAFLNVAKDQFGYQFEQVCVMPELVEASLCVCGDTPQLHIVRRLPPGPGLELIKASYCK